MILDFILQHFRIVFISCAQYLRHRCAYYLIKLVLLMLIGCSLLFVIYSIALERQNRTRTKNHFIFLSIAGDLVLQNKPGNFSDE